MPGDAVAYFFAAIISAVAAFGGFANVEAAIAKKIFIVFLVGAILSAVTGTFNPDRHGRKRGAAPV